MAARDAGGALLREPATAQIVEFWEPSFRQRPEDRAEFWDIIFANFAHVLIVDDVAERLIPTNAPPLAGNNFYVNLLCLHAGDEAWLPTAVPTYGVSTGSKEPRP